VINYNGVQEHLPGDPPGESGYIGFLSQDTSSAYQCPSGGFHALHTHDGSGIIHCELPWGDVTPSLGEFFTIWGQPLSSGRAWIYSGSVSAKVVDMDAQTTTDYSSNPASIPFDHPAGGPYSNPYSIPQNLIFYGQYGNGQSSGFFAGEAVYLNITAYTGSQRSVPGSASAASKPNHRNFPLAYRLMGLPGLLAYGPTSRREHTQVRSLPRQPVSSASSPTPRAVLFVADLLHPVDDLALEFLLDGDVRHRAVRRGAVPMLLSGRTRDHISGMNLFDRTSLALHEASTIRHNERLTQGMVVPSRECARFEADARTSPTASLDVHSRHLLPSLESSAEAGTIDDETIAHVTALHARVGIVDFLDGDDFCVRDDFVLAAVVEHLLRLGNPADVGAREAPVAKEEHARIKRG